MSSYNRRGDLEEAYILLQAVALVVQSSGSAAGRWDCCQGCILLVLGTRIPPGSSHLCGRWILLIQMGAFSEMLDSHGLCDPLEAESHTHKRAWIPCLTSPGVPCRCFEEHHR